MSHTWHTGQSRTHAISRNLQRLLPRLKVWLDVDELHNVDDLEQSVSESAVFCLFYSAGYFGSVNCRKEIYAAVEQEKPIIVLYEGDDSVIADLEKECNNDCTQSPGSASILEHLFKNDPICWLNEGAYSAATLNRVYTCIFNNMPYYQNGHMDLLEGGVNVPGELGPVSLPTKAPLTILVCESNEGALAVAEEIEAMVSSDAVTIKFLDDTMATHEQASMPTEEESSLLHACNSSGDSHHSVLLLYLNQDTFLDDGGAVTAIVKNAIDSKIEIILVHEKSKSKHGCPFSLFFTQTPSELLCEPYELFKDIAIPLYSTPEYRIVSLRQIICKLGGILI